jgi:cell division protein FtsN
LPPGTEALYRAALGPAAAHVYLPIFARFETRGRSGAVWSPRAAVGNLAWLVYWRLWDAVLALASLTVAGAGALGWLWTRADGVPMGVRVGLTATVGVLWCALPGLWGVAWLHSGLRQRMTAAVEEADTFKEAIERLERSENAWRLRGLGAAAAVTLAVALLAGVVWQLWGARETTREPSSAPPKQAPASHPVPGPVPVPMATDTQPALAKPEPEPDLEPVIESPSATPTAAPLPSAPEAQGIRPRPRGFGVNVGMFAVAGNAARVKARLAEADLPVLDDPVESARGPLTRIRVGPFEQREQAEAAARTVRALGLEARVYAP